MEYRAIVKRKPNDELQHWKYIKRVKMPSGKWKYIYDPDQELTKYKNKLTTNQTVDDDETDLEKVTKYEQTDKLFDSISRMSIETGPFFVGDKRHRTEYTTHKQGKLSRAAAKGEKWIFDNLISDKKKTASQRKKKRK